MIRVNYAVVSQQIRPEITHSPNKAPESPAKKFHDLAHVCLLIMMQRQQSESFLLFEFEKQ